MWRKVFTELKGDEFADNHVMVDARFMSVPLGTQLVHKWLFWHVSIV